MARYKQLGNHKQQQAVQSARTPRRSAHEIARPTSPLRAAVLQNDPFELAAERAPAAAARDGAVAHDLIRPRTASNASTARGAGAPLPGGLRAAMETIFAASFDAVRIHADAEAAEMAAAADARAFAAGSHIYFAHGAYRPDHAEGRALLVHELVHVLQQTAQRAEDGRLIATARTGRAPVQHAPAAMTVATFDLLTPDERVAHLRSVHEAASPGLKAKLDVWFPTFYRSASQQTPAEAIVALDAQVDAAKGDRAQLGFMLDIARVFQADDLVVKIIRTDGYVKSVTCAPRILRKLAADATLGDWWATALTTTWTPKQFWPDGFRKLLHDYLWTTPPDKGKAVKYPTMEGKGVKSSLSAIIAASSKECADFGKLNNSEWAIGAVIALRHLEVLLHDLFATLDTQASITQESPSGESGQLEITNKFKRQYAKASAFVYEGGRLAELAGPDPKQELHWWWAERALGALMREEGEAAQPFWEEAIRQQEVHATLFWMRSSTVLAADDPLLAYMREIPDFAALLHDAAVLIKDQLPAYLKVDPNDKRTERYRLFPNQAEAFAEHIDRKVVDDYTGRTLKTLAAGLALGSETEGEQAQTLAGALAWFTAWASNLADQVRAVSMAKLATEDPEEAIDLIIVNRYEIARELMSVAQALQAHDNSWAAIYKIADSVHQAADIQTSELAIAYPFQVQKEADIAMLPMDVGAAMLVGLEPFSAQDVAYLYETRWLEQYNGILGELVAARQAAPTDATREDIFLTGRTDVAMHALVETRPHRYLTEAIYWMRYASDPVDQFGRVLEEHPRFRSVMITALGQERELLHSETGPGEGNVIAVWTIPDPGEIVKPLRQISALNALVYLYINESSHFATRTVPLPELEGSEPDGADEDAVEAVKYLLSDAALQAAMQLVSFDTTEVDGLSDWEWYTTLREIVGVESLLKPGVSPFKDQLTAIKTSYATALETAQTTRDDLDRSATNLDRQVVGKSDSHSIQKLLAEYTGRVDTIQQLDLVLKILEVFERNAAPTNERPLQMAAIMLENGPDFWSALQQLRMFYFNAAFFPYVSKALEDADRTLAAGNILLGDAAAQQQTKEQGVEALANLKRHMLERLKESQRQFGIQGDASAQTLTSLLEPAFKIRAGEPVYDEEGDLDKDGPDGPFRIEGLTIHVKKVLHSFTYFPRLGVEGPHSLYAPARLFVGELVDRPRDEGFTLDAKEPGGAKVDLVEVILLFGAKQQTSIMITNEDLNSISSGLYWLDKVVHLRSVVKNLENLQDVILTFGEGLMFIASLTPVGWAVDLAMLIKMVAEAFGDDPDSISKQLEAVFNEPGQIFERLLQKIRGSLNVEKLLEIFLFGENHYVSLIESGGHEAQPTGRAGKRKGAISKAMRGIRNLGKSIALQLFRLQTKVQNKVTVVEGAVLTRPLLAAVLQWTVENWANLKQPERLILQHSLLGPIFEAVMLAKRKAGQSSGALSIADGLDSQAADFAAHVHAMIAQMTELELPAEVVPNELLIGLLLDAFTDYVSKKAPGKVRILTMFINESAEYLGAKDALAEELGRMAKGSYADPNTYWTRYLIPELERPFNDMLGGLSGKVNDVLASAPILSDFGLSVPKAPAVQVTTSTHLNEAFESDEAKAILPAEGAVAAAHSPSLKGAPSAVGMGAAAPRFAAPAGGMPISGAVRSVNERRFGHDFGHVRLHTGSDASRRTAALGADALTSGSHIYLSGGLSPNFGAGARIFRHELAHVLQKSGPRPLGGAHSSSPLVQRGANAVRINLQEEHDADQMAELSMNPQGASVPILGAHRAGVSRVSAADKAEAAVKTFLDQISNVKRVSDLYGNVKATTGDAAALKRTTGGVNIDVLREAAALWRTIKGHLDSGTKVAYSTFLTSRKMEAPAREFLLVRIGDSARHGAITDAIKVLAAENQRDDSTAAAQTGGKGAAGSAPAASPKVLDIHSFLAALELYMLGRSGIAIRIEAKIPAAGKPFDADAIVKKVLFVGIQLRWIESDMSLWNTVVSNTWPLPDSKQADKRKWAKKLIDSEDDLPDLWDSAAFKFSNDFKDKVERAVNPPALSAQDLPVWDEFKQTKPKGTNQVAVHIGTHGEFTSSYPLAKLDRQSHHTTQFLVAEYFHNVKGFKPFPKDRDWPASVTFTGDDVSTIKKTTSAADGIRVKDTFAGNRGGKMPAILLSGKTHLERESLHVTATGDEKTSPSQGYTINSLFDHMMPAEMRQNVDKTAHNQYVAQQPDKAAQQIYVAVQRTYGDVRNEMAKKLQMYVPKNEVAYYKGVADTEFTKRIAGVPGASEVAKEANMIADLKAVTDQVTAEGAGHNDSTLKPLGWDAEATA